MSLSFPLRMNHNTFYEAESRTTFTNVQPNKQIGNFSKSGSKRGCPPLDAVSRPEAHVRSHQRPQRAKREKNSFSLVTRAEY